MGKKHTGLNAGGLAHSEILPGDLFKDHRGERLTVKTVTDGRITFIREGYSGECVLSRMRFEKEFTAVQRQTFGEWCMANDTAGKIKALKDMLAAGRAKK